MFDSDKIALESTYDFHFQAVEKVSGVSREVINPQQAVLHISMISSSDHCSGKCSSKVCFKAEREKSDLGACTNGATGTRQPIALLEEKPAEEFVNMC